jgi:hypothetical protein
MISRIAQYRRVSLGIVTPQGKVYPIVKHRPSVGRGPSFFDTFFYTLPVREHSGYTNSVIAFTCDAQAREACKALNAATDKSQSYRANHNEPTFNDCKVGDFTLSEIAYYSNNLGLPLVVVHSSYCQGTMREPFFEVTVIYDPV